MDSGFQYKRNFIRRTLCSSQNRKARESRSIWVTQLITNRKTVLHNLSTCSHCWQSTWTLNPVPLSLLFQKSDLETSAASSWENKQVLPRLLVLTTNFVIGYPKEWLIPSFRANPDFCGIHSLVIGWVRGKTENENPRLEGLMGLYFPTLCAPFTSWASAHAVTPLGTVAFILFG